MDSKAPDVVLLGPEWPERALLRAQLIEEGCDVVAIDSWPMPRLYRQPETKPRLLVLDLHGLPDPRETLDEVRFVMPRDRVLVLSALGTIPADDIRGLGFQVIERPATVGQIAARAAALVAAKRPTIGHSVLDVSLSHTLEGEMRKQDRIRQQQELSEQQHATRPQPEPREREQVKGSAEQPNKPQRQPGRIPLPD